MFFSGAVAASALSGSMATAVQRPVSQSSDIHISSGSSLHGAPGSITRVKALNTGSHTGIGITRRGSQPGSAVQITVHQQAKQPVALETSSRLAPLRSSAMMCPITTIQHTITRPSVQPLPQKVVSTSVNHTPHTAPPPHSTATAKFSKYNHTCILS